MSTKNTKGAPSIATILTLAGKAVCDPRTAAKALEKGPQCIRSRAVRERIVEAMRELDLTPVAA